MQLNIKTHIRYLLYMLSVTEQSNPIYTFLGNLISLLEILNECLKFLRTREQFMRETTAKEAIFQAGTTS